MKKRGKLAFIIYIIGCLFAGVILIAAYVESQNIPEPDVENWGAFGVALLILLAMIIGIPSGIGFVLKSLHLATDIKFFGVLCILLDVVMLLYLAGVHQIVTHDFAYWLESLSITNLIYVAIPLLALISNARSLAE